MKKILLPLLLCLIVHCNAQSIKIITPANKPEDAGMSSERLQRIDKMIEDQVANNNLPGAVALIVRNGKIVYYKAFGTSNIETRMPLKKDDIFRIASQTKAITSLAVMMLYEEGKFQLDDPISMYIPEFKKPTVLKTFNAKDSTFLTEPAKSEITIRQLLTHSSGIDYAVIGGETHKAIYAKNGISPGIGNEKTSLGDEIKILAKLPLSHHPGERWTYGLNSDVLGYLVEILSGQPLDEFMKTRIFDKLGMKDTYFRLPKEKHSRLVALHTAKKNGDPIVMKDPALDVHPDYPKREVRYLSGGGGLSSPIEDYAKFLQLFLNKGEYNGVRLLSRKTVELMLTDQLHSPVEMDMGLGFGLETVSGDYRTILSAGSFQWGGAFNTQYWADPKENLIGLIYTNVFNTPHWKLGDKFKVLTYQAIND